MDYLEHAVELATQSARTGGGPFGAVLVTGDGQTFEGTNAVTRTPDPTAHAEIVAIRAAAQGLGTHLLDDATLYSSCQPCPMCLTAALPDVPHGSPARCASRQPCPMCLTAALWARIPRIVFAASQEDVADGGFDDSKFYTELSKGLASVESAEIVADPRPNRTEPFEAFLANEHIPY